MSYRNKTYVCFDADSDMRYYRLMQAWKENEGIAFDFYNAHDYNDIREWSTPESKKQQLRERMSNSKNFIVLIGENTKKLRGYVPWEIELAMKHGLPIIAVNLNGERSIDFDLCPSVLKDELAMYAPFSPKIIQYSLDNWPELHAQHVKAGETGPYHWVDGVYTELGY